MEQCRESVCVDLKLNQLHFSCSRFIQTLDTSGNSSDQKRSNYMAVKLVTCGCAVLDVLQSLDLFSLQM
jgi:hypothetical protein